MKKPNPLKNKHRTAYKKPELVCYGSLSSITKSSSGGTVPDGGSAPNMNVTMA